LSISEKRIQSSKIASIVITVKANPACWKEYNVL
jgi:hypothetical protein